MEFHTEGYELGRASIDIPLFATIETATNARPLVAPPRPVNVLNAAFARTRHPDWLPPPIAVFDIQD